MRLKWGFARGLTAGFLSGVAVYYFMTGNEAIAAVATAGLVFTIVVTIVYGLDDIIVSIKEEKGS